MSASQSVRRRRQSTLPRWLILGVPVLILLAVGVWQIGIANSGPVYNEAPEAAKIMATQAEMPFQILIPAFLPPEFERANVEIDTSQVGPGGEPMVQLTYRTKRNATLFVRQWVPVNPDKEILSGSRPVETKWGKGWLLTEGQNLAALWSDVGPLRVSTYTRNLDLVSKERLIQIADTLGPASNAQVFSFEVDPPGVRNVQPAPPFEVPTNAQGVQEFTLVVTPGGYDPLRFSVKQGVPVKMTFRALGQVGCGKELILPTDSKNMSSIYLKTDTETQVFEFTPVEAGVFQFHCSHNMYRGVMYVTQ